MFSSRASWGAGQAGRRFADACEQDHHLVLRPPAGLPGPRSELSNGSIATVGMIQPDAATLHLWPNRTRVTGQEGWACPFKRWLVVLCRADDVVVRGRILGRKSGFASDGSSRNYR